MGVPKFFRYISERYPCLSELAREQCIPEFDNLYLDMNGIIHTCSHPEDENIHFSITEEKMFNDIFNYIDKLFFLIKPQKLFFMAVDGVAPRAKMNQQRSRRFRSAKDAELLEAKAKSRGEVLPNERFDSNCITPGTEFMVRLQEALRYFIKHKISSDPLWQNCRIILSGHNTPGEGEHKIMDYIRYLKSQNDYNPNTRHCLYGLDADLIILGLCTHELHFVVLREEVKFGRKANKHKSVEETRFFLLHLGLLREYLEMEFEQLKEHNPDLDISKLIDDWVLMGFLVGNDFVPHLPCMHISSNALPLLYKTYIKVYPSLKGNINEEGKLNLERLEKYFAALSEVEFEIFQENHADLKYFEAKKSKNGIDEAFDFDVSQINNATNDSDLADLIENSRMFLEDSDGDLSDSEQHLNDEFETYKRNYYMNKYNQNNSNNESKREQAICYITALQWILDYYYRGVQSWDWYYPHHYAPFISDLTDFKDYKIEFNLGNPFLPFEQLLAVLPAASKDLLPVAYRDLMTNESSELIHFYPRDFETDLNGKKNEWEAVVLIPFIDENLLLRAMKTCEKKLTKSEINRNKHGPMLQYDHCKNSVDTIPGIYSMKTLHNVYCTEKPIWLQEIAVPINKTACVELPNSSRKVFFPGFPTMKHLNYDFEIRNARVRVFDNPSRNESLILKPKNRKDFDDIVIVAGKLLNQVVFIGWPHLIKAKVFAISSKDKYIDSDGIKDMDQKSFQLHVRTAQEHLTTRMGIEFDDFNVMVHVRTHIGSSYGCSNHGKVVINDVWSVAMTVYPAQGTISEITVHKNVVTHPKKVEQLFPCNSKVFFAGNPYFGSEGTVLDPRLVYECGRLMVNIIVLPEPDFTEAKQIQQNLLDSDYVNSFQAAAALGVQKKCLDRVTSSVFLVAGARRYNIPENISKFNIGLQLRFPKQQEERCGYVRRVSNQWLYSSKAIELIKSYCEQFPVVFDLLSHTSDQSGLWFEEDLFPNEVGEGKVEEILSWINNQAHTQAQRIACGSQAMEKEAVEKVLESIEHLKTLPVKTVKLQVKPHLLLKPDVTLPHFYKSGRTINLFDRVIVVKTTYMVPLGSKGTVIGIYPVSDPNPVRLECVKVVYNFYDVLFDKPVPSGHDIYGIADERVYKVPETSVLLLSNQETNKIEMQDVKVNKLTSVNKSNNNVVKSIPPETQGKPESASKISSSKDSSLKAKQHLQQSQTYDHKASNHVPPKMREVAHDDFWIPSVDTKVKRTIKNDTFVGNSNTQNNKIITEMSEKNSQECQAKTQALKTILGLTQSSTSSFPPLKGKGNMQLPPPPAVWRSDAQNANQSHPTLISHVNNDSSRVPQSRTFDNSAGSYVQQNFVNTPRFPIPTVQCSQNESHFNADSLNQKGAFIPLQVMRGNLQQPVKQNQTKTKQPQEMNKVGKKLINVSGVDKIQQNLNKITLNSNAEQQVDHTSAENYIPTKSETKRRKPRVPKIGARFDFAN